MAKTTWNEITTKRNNNKMTWIYNKMIIMIKKLTKPNSNGSVLGNNLKFTQNKLKMV